MKMPQSYALLASQTWKYSKMNLLMSDFLPMKCVGKYNHIIIYLIEIESDQSFDRFSLKSEETNIFLFTYQTFAVYSWL